MPDVIAIAIMFTILGATIWIGMREWDRRLEERGWRDE